jgi:hypothetical protein
MGVLILSHGHVPALTGAIVGLVVLTCNDSVTAKSLKVHCEEILAAEGLP